MTMESDWAVKRFILSWAIVSTIGFLVIAFLYFNDKCESEKQSQDEIVKLTCPQPKEGMEELNVSDAKEIEEPAVSTTSSNIGSPSHKTNNLFSDNLNRVRNFACQDPLPRAFRIRDIVKEPLWDSGEDIFPEFTVLHRCDNSSGICFNGMDYECAVDEPEEIEIEVSVYSVVNIGSDKSNERKVRIKVDNHTKCDCAHIFIK